jgi:hypothetical protein
MSLLKQIKICLEPGKWPVVGIFLLACGHLQLIRSIPPVIGWVSAGGSLPDTQIVEIVLFFFSWQIPHFW